MRFNYIKLKNFLCYGEDLITLPLYKTGITFITGENKKSGGSNGSGKCVFKGTKLITKELGEIEIQDLVPDAKYGFMYYPTKPLHILSEDESWQLVKCFWITDPEELYEIETENGRKLIASGDHRVMTKDGWKKLKDITEKDEILTR